MAKFEFSKPINPELKRAGMVEVWTEDEHGPRGLGRGLRMLGYVKKQDKKWTAYSYGRDEHGLYQIDLGSAGKRGDAAELLRAHRSSNPLAVTYPDRYELGDPEELGEPLTMTTSWKVGDRRRSKRVELDPELGDLVRLGKAAREEARIQAATAAEHGPRGPRLLTFVRKLGGVIFEKDDPLSGELRHAYETMQGTRTKGVLKKYRHGLKGLSLARMSEAVAEAGYDHERDDQAELLEMLETEARLGASYFPRWTNPRGLRSRAGRRYGSSPAATGDTETVAKRLPPRHRSGPKKGQFRKRAKGASSRKPRKRRSRNPALYAVNPTKRRTSKRRSSNPAKKTRRKRASSAVGGFFSRLKPTGQDAGAGAGLILADMGANLVQTKFAKGKDNLFWKIAEVFGALFGARLGAKLMGMIPVAGIKSAAGAAYKAAWPGAMYRAYKRIVIPAIPAGKVRTKLGEWGLRGYYPEPLYGFVVDGGNGMAYELDGLGAVPAGYLPPPSDEFDDDYDDLGDLETVISGMEDDDLDDYEDEQGANAY